MINDTRMMVTTIAHIRAIVATIIHATLIIARTNRTDEQHPCDTDGSIFL